MATGIYERLKANPQKMASKSVNPIPVAGRRAIQKFAERQRLARWLKYEMPMDSMDMSFGSPVMPHGYVNEIPVCFELIEYD